MSSMSCTDPCITEYDEDFIEDSETSPELERELLLFATSFMGELRYIAKRYIINFFRNETFSQGGKIPRDLLLSNSHISMVINYDITKGVDEAYNCLQGHDFCVRNSEVPEDIELVVSILNKLSASNVPQQFAGGMIMLYLKLVEGVDIG